MSPSSPTAPAPQDAVGVIDAPERASAMLPPLRLRILERLRDPGSAAAVARDLDLPRQRVHYHVKQLEEADLVRHVEDRRKGNCVERVVQASARRFVISPAALGAVAPDPDDVRDRFSSAYLLSAAARTIRDVALLREGADRAGKKLPTLTLEADVRFAGPGEQAAFAEDLTRAFREVVARYHDEGADDGRTFRVAFTGHPVARRVADEASPGEP